MRFEILRNITTKIGSGATPTGGERAYKSEGISLIRSQNVLDFYFSKTGLAFIDEEQAKALDNVNVEENDILLNITGDSIARCCMVPTEILPARVNQHVSIIRCDDLVNPLYVFYFLQYLKPYLLKICGVGGTRNALTKEVIEQLNITIPDNQNQIAEVLSAIDDKISLNNRINAELEQMAKTIYDYWFVQFDFPISAAEAATMGKPELEGKPYRSSGGEMVWNEELKREVPAGWGVKSLFDIAIYTNGLAMQNHRPKSENKVPVIKIKEMNEGFSNSTEYARGNLESEYLVNSGDILFSWSASLNAMIWADRQGALNQHIFKVTSNEYPRYYIYYQILNYLDHFKQMAENRKTTMGHITKDHLIESTILVPEDQFVIQKGGEHIESILDIIVLNKMQNQALAKHRDFLLPLLMNGDVRLI